MQELYPIIFFYFIKAIIRINMVTSVTAAYDIWEDRKSLRDSDAGMDNLQSVYPDVDN